VPTTNFLDGHKASVSQDKFPFSDAAKYGLLSHKPLGVLVYGFCWHAVDHTGHGLVPIHSGSVFLQSILLSRDPVDDAGFNGAVVGVEEAHSV